ncbi:putative ribonuclease H-like domain-containing protein [Tanacetum coccineum]
MPSRPDLSFVGLDGSVYKTKVSETETSISKTSKDIIEKPKTVRPSAPIIKDWDTDGDNDSVFRPKSDQTKQKFTKINFVKSDENAKSGRVTAQKEIRPVWNNAQRVNYQNKFTHPHPKRNFIPTAVVTKSRQVPVHTAKQSSPRATTSISTARPVNIAAPKPKVNDALPTTYSYFKSAAKTNKFNEKVNTARVNNVTTAGPKAVVSAAVGNRKNVVKSSTCWIWRPTGNVSDHTSKDSGSYMLKRFDYVDLQGRLKHMTGNKFFLTDYQENDGGFVAFGGSPKGGKISRKGKIRTGKLDFEDVYFIKEFKFNYFLVSQMCDKKNNVLFTKTECLVLSPDFKLLDESQVLLKVPRQNNMYSFDLKNVVPSGNRVLVTKPHNKTPYELLHGRPPSISFMRPFGCPVTILNTLDPLGKFDEKADEGFFVGYSINSKAFRVFNTRTRKVEENLHITFLENKPNVAGSGPDWLFDIDLLTNSMNYEPVIVGNQTNKNAGIKDNTQQYILLPLLFDSPKSSEDAVADDADDQNVQDFRVALDNLLVHQKEGYANSTNRDSIVSPSISATGQSFTNADDLPTNLFMPDLEDTANLLNTGIFSGAYDDEYVGAEVNLNNLETTMNVIPIPTTRIHKDHPNDQIIRDINLATQTRRMTKIYKVLAMVSYIKKAKENKSQRLSKLLICLFSLTNRTQEGDTSFDRSKLDRGNSAFLYGTIEEEVYVCQPPGFEDPQFPGKVYKREKALYGLHQAPRAWYETLSTYLLENGFRRGIIDKTLFIKKDKGDILLVQVMQRDDGIFISQDKYVADILKKFDFVTMKTASTPIETHKALLKDEEAEDVDVHLYRSMIGSLMYLTASRPDIMFAVCACARFQVTPKVSHLHAVKRIFRYLKGQHKLGIWYPRDSPFDLEAFSNSDYSGASLDRKSTTGGCQFLDKRLISCIRDNFGNKTGSCKVNTARQDTKIPQSSGPPEKVGDEAVYKELGDIMERAITTASSLEAEQDCGSGLKCQDTILGDVDAQTRFETTSK